MPPVRPSGDSAAAGVPRMRSHGSRLPDLLSRISVPVVLTGLTVSSVILTGGSNLLRAATTPGPAAPGTLRCEYMEDPLGVDTAEPRFAWVLAHSDRGERQTAYQVLVSTTPDALGQGRGDQWDSGKVAGDDF